MPFYLPPTTPPDVARVEQAGIQAIHAEAFPFGPRFLSAVNPRNSAGRTIPGLPQESLADYHLERVKRHLMFIRVKSNPPLSGASSVARPSLPVVLQFSPANRLNHSGPFTIAPAGVSGATKVHLTLTQPLPTLLQPETEATVSAVSRAEQAMLTPFLSVMDKPQIPPSGDKHDYFSLVAPANRDATPTGMDSRPGGYAVSFPPDASSLKRFSQAVQALALGYQMTQKPRYAEKAAALLNHWFLNPASRMNPNLAQAQMSPQTERGTISAMRDRLPESGELAELTTALTMLGNTPSTLPALNAGLRAWYAAYLDWLKTGPIARQEAHRSDTDRKVFRAQVAMIERYLGEKNERPAATKPN